MAEYHLRPLYIETTCPICGQPIIMERTKFGYRPRDYAEEYHLCKPEPDAEGVVVEPYYPDERCWQWKIRGLCLMKDELAAQDLSGKDVCEICPYNRTCSWVPEAARRR